MSYLKLQWTVDNGGSKPAYIKLYDYHTGKCIWHTLVPAHGGIRLGWPDPFSREPVIVKVSDKLEDEPL